MRREPISKSDLQLQTLILRHLKSHHTSGSISCVCRGRSIFFCLHKDSLDVGFTENLTHPTRCQNVNMLVNATREAFKSPAMHVGHVATEQALTNSSHSFLFSYSHVCSSYQLVCNTSQINPIYGQHRQPRTDGSSWSECRAVSHASRACLPLRIHGHFLSVHRSRTSLVNLCG